jgi:chloramphenicol-sensitive protein RarD
MNAGTLFAVAAYVCWGLSPAYWKWLQHVPSGQLLAHRIAWSFLLLAAGIALTRRGPAFRAALRQPRVLLRHAATALLVGVNWLTFVWAVNAGFIVETGLGYFITPLLSVLLGVVVLRERLRPWQWGPIALVAAAIAILAAGHGAVPWIALTLASTWSLYGLLTKRTPLGSLAGLTLETGLLVLPCLAFLALEQAEGRGALLRCGTGTDLLLAGTGVLTAVPLLFFNAALRRIPLFRIGLLQYIGPTLQLVLGVLVYGEPFTRDQAIGFGLVWVALLLFVLEDAAARRSRRVPATDASAPPETPA